MNISASSQKQTKGTFNLISINSRLNYGVAWTGRDARFLVRLKANNLSSSETCIIDLSTYVYTDNPIPTATEKIESARKTLICIRSTVSASNRQHQFSSH